MSMSPPASDYRLGDEILRCEPFAYVVNSALHTDICDFCLREPERPRKSLFKCVNCKYVAKSFFKTTNYKSHTKVKVAFLKCGVELDRSPRYFSPILVGTCIIAARIVSVRRGMLIGKNANISRLSIQRCPPTPSD